MNVLPTHYLDANATTPMCPEAEAAYTAALRDHWHNPSSLYPAAAAAHQLLDDARENLADLLGCDEPQRILFTSGATESNNALLAHLGKKSPRHAVLIGPTEHPSVYEPADAHFPDTLESIPTDLNSVIDLTQLRTRLSNSKSQPAPGPIIALVSVMAANNETGVLQPWKKIRDLCAEFHVPYHCDAAQWLGKLPAPDIAQCDYVTGSAHKFRGPKGIGFLITPEDSDLRIQIGGPQESNRRAGTENLPAILAMVAALESTLAASASVSKSTAQSRDQFESEIVRSIPGTQVAGATIERLWNTCMLVMPDHGNLRWITRLNRYGIAASTGSACSAGKGKPSLSLAAMGFDFDQMGRALRFSADWNTSLESWQILTKTLPTIWQELAAN